MDFQQLCKYHEDEKKRLISNDDEKKKYEKTLISLKLYLLFFMNFFLVILSFPSKSVGVTYTYSQFSGKGSFLTETFQ